MTVPGPENAFDHVVSAMFENRTFDNLLGRLYQPGEVASFEGVIGKELTNPIPDWAEHGADHKVVPYGVATNMDSPNPDSGEEYTHVNTQFFGVIDPPGNRCLLSEQMTPPFNAPERHAAATMDGFVADYISAFTAEVGRQPGSHLGLSDHEEEKLTLIWVAWSTMAACVLGRCCRRRRRTDTVSDSSSCSARTYSCPCPPRGALIDQLPADDS